MNGTNEARQSPSIGSAQMPPPMNASSRIPSGSPHPQAFTNGVGSTSTHSTTPINSHFRQPGKGENWKQVHLRISLKGFRDYGRSHYQLECPKPRWPSRQRALQSRHTRICHSDSAVNYYNDPIYPLLPEHHTDLLCKSHAPTQQNHRHLQQSEQPKTSAYSAKRGTRSKTACI